MQTRCLIDGQWTGSVDGRELDVRDPATDEVLARVPLCTAPETRAAIDAAARGFPDWRDRPADERARPLHRLAALMLAHREELARLMTRELGKPLVESRGEVAYAASFIEWAAGEAPRVYGEIVPASRTTQRILVLRQPIGITASITPWNFPAAMVTRKLGPALAAGCPMIVKPAEQTPLSALAIAELAVEAGIPPGVIAVVTGDPVAIGEALFADPRVRKVSFTGSQEVGRLLVHKAADRLVALTLELGGHAPFIVLDDADLDAAVRGAIATKFRNAGQTCICANRFYVQRGVHDEFVARLAAAVRELRVGNGLDEGVAIGPLVDDAAVAKVEAHVADALAHGATLRCGGTRVTPRPGLADRFYAPTVLDGMLPDMLCAREETFGPVAPVAVVADENEAIELANASEYGLAGYVYTRDASRLLRIAERLEVGIVGANDSTPSTAQAPFGGVKQSGWGREGGKWGMDAYLDTKYVSWGI